MFVSVVCDLANDDSRISVYNLLKQYGLKMVIKDVFETSSIKETMLARLKRDIDKATDFYDKIRIYQYPIDNTLAITYLTEKRWKKTTLKI